MICTGRTLALVGMLLSGILSAQARTPTATSHMRDTGYVLGDFLEQRVDLSAPDSAELLRDSIPALGRINNWLELRAVHVEDARHLVFTYQVFAAVEQALQLAIPPFKLRLRDGGQEVLVSVPNQPFYMSPVLPGTLSEQDRQPRVSITPKALPERRLQNLTLACTTLVLLLGLYLAWAHDALPWIDRRPGPMARLFRSLRRQARAAETPERYRAQLSEVQTALNTCAAETLYEATLPRLFERAPHLAPLRAEIESLFRHSREIFYGDGSATPWPETELLALCRRARDAERGLR